jgi:tRNA-Thr(GGU) m(6)t(6)A37 methyltransferase TsaA
VSAKGEVRFVGVVEESGEAEAKVKIFPEYCAGLKGVEQYSHLIILYWFHLRDSEENRGTLLVVPRRHAVNFEVGVFSCRSPSRPNPIGLCVVELLKIDKCVLTVKGLDALEDSLIVDIKPYQPRADSVPNARAPDWTLRGPIT